MVKTQENVKTLTKDMSKLKIKFDRAAYKASYDAVYFKRRQTCIRCKCTVCAHMMRRHQATKKCRNIATSSQ